MSNVLPHMIFILKCELLTPLNPNRFQQIFQDFVPSNIHNITSKLTAAQRNKFSEVLLIQTNLHWHKISAKQ